MKLPSKEYYSRFKKLSNKDQLEMIDLYRRSHRIDTYYKTALLRFDDRLELTEISERLKINITTVYKRLRRFSYKIYNIKKY